MRARSCRFGALVALPLLAASACRERAPQAVRTPTTPSADGARVDAGAPRSCESLATLSLPHATVVETRVVAETTSPKTPAHCRVLAIARPTTDSEIRVLVAIPIGDAWTGRFQQVGSGGFSGFLPEDDLRDALAAGNAAAGTDDGHSAAPNDARWALGHREKLVDYGYRALKETRDAALAIVRAFTGRAPTRSYFTGCSDGGREALMMAQRFPDDFDGIVAQAPANDATRVLFAMAWNALAAERAGFLSAGKRATIQAAARRACADAEGIVEDPPACAFDPSTLGCHGAPTDACLTEPELAAVRAIYDGPRSPRTGARIFPGLEPGAEAVQGSWDDWFVGHSPQGAAGTESRMLATGFFQSMLFGDPTFQLAHVDFDRDLERADRELAPILDARDADLRPLGKHGKLILLHGWSDPAIPPRGSIAYYDRVREVVGDPRAFFRLFLAPGVLHCGGGPGPSDVATLDAITAWVERGQAPDSLLARKHEDDDPAKPIALERPLCPYPQQALWDGAGDRSRAGSWRCAERGKSR